MKKFIFTILAVVVAGSLAVMANAQMMGNFSNTTVDWDEVVEHTNREEQAGKEVWDKLQAKELACENLGDEQFGVLGEYFMGQLAGAAHAAMNAMMIQMHGEIGEEQIHIVMGKRLSGCDTSAAFPSQGIGFMPMMQMMVGGWSSSFSSNNSTNNMMDFGFGPFGNFGWIFMVLWWVLIIAGIVALIKWLMNQSREPRRRDKPTSPTGGSALEILRERYAKGEINQSEFEEKKKDLV